VRAGSLPQQVIADMGEDDPTLPDDDIETMAYSADLQFFAEHENAH